MDTEWRSWGEAWARREGGDASAWVSKRHWRFKSSSKQGEHYILGPLACISNTKQTPEGEYKSNGSFPSFNEV